MVCFNVCNDCLALASALSANEPEDGGQPFSLKVRSIGCTLLAVMLLAPCGLSSQ